MEKGLKDGFETQTINFDKDCKNKKRTKAIPKIYIW